MFGVDTIELNLEPSSRDDLLVALGNKLHEHDFVKKSYVDAVLQRESVHPTGLPSPLPDFAIAIPHTDPEHVLRSRIAVATVKEPVPFSMMGSPDVTMPVRIVFMLAIQDPKKQPEVLRNLVKLIKDERLLDDIRNATEKAQVHALLTRHFNVENEGGNNNEKY